MAKYSKILILNTKHKIKSNKYNNLDNVNINNVKIDC